jgi:hypothetical protein
METISLGYYGNVAEPPRNPTHIIDLLVIIVLGVITVIVFDHFITRP